MTKEELKAVLLEYKAKLEPLKNDPDLNSFSTDAILTSILILEIRSLKRQVAALKRLTPRGAAPR